MGIEDLQPPIDGDHLQPYHVASLATETKPLQATEANIYQGLFNIAMGRFREEAHGITPEDAATILEAHYPERFGHDQAVYVFRAGMEKEDAQRKLSQEIDKWGTTSS